MIFGVSFHELAEAELEEAREYYGRVSSGLAEAFIDEAERATRQIIEYPQSAPEVRAGVRKKLLRKFPYAILYSIRKEDVRILALMNLKRRPFYWRGRK